MRLLAFLLFSTAALLAQAAEPTSYGKTFADGPVVPVATALGAFDAHAGKAQRFSGRITEVCQARGCWMMLEDGGVAARVMFGDHAFFLPRDTKGTAVVHGVLSRKELTPEQVEHLGRDGGKGVLAQPVEYRIVADGVRVEGA